MTRLLSPLVLGGTAFALWRRPGVRDAVRRLFGLPGGRHGIKVHHSVRVRAPVERVWECWARFENFPSFMRNVREVRDLGDGRSRWVVAGPAGVPVEWDAIVTDRRPNRVIAWCSEPGSTVKTAGNVHLTPLRDGTTLVSVRMSYEPPGGAVGHAVASLFGADPKSEMAEDLERMRASLESGGGGQTGPQPAAAGA
jgi:uncharacterized membrane protein